MADNKTLRDHASGLAESLAPRVEIARDKAAPVLADARDKVAPYVSDTRDRVAPLIAEMRDIAAPYVSDARNIAGPYVATARDKAAPYVADARERVTVTFTTEVLPVVTAALAAVDEATEDARHETLKRGKAVAAALRGELAEQEVVPQAEESHKLRAVLVALGLGGAGYAAFKKFGSGNKSTSTGWQSSTTSSSARVSDTPLADAAAEAAADDVAASDPAEAAADANEAPHIATTPDRPATQVDLDRK
jgi:hypothetical protein